MIVRPAAIGCCVLLTAVALPIRVDAQQTAFVHALSELTATLEGTAGDERARIAAALDTMSAALAAWDREITVAESEWRDTRSNAASLRTAEQHLSLGQLYANRGRLADALAELGAASRLAPTRADIHVLRALVLQRQGTPADTMAAFRSALALAPGDPVIAYHLFREALTTGNRSAAQEVSSLLAAAYARLLQEQSPGKGTFTRLAPLQEGAPVLPYAAYREAYRAVGRGEYERAIAEFRKAAAGDPLLVDPAAGSTVMARAFDALRQGRLTDAQSVLEQSRLPAESSEARRLLGLVLWAKSEYDKSIASLSSAITLSPSDERARLTLARVLNAAGRDADAERALHETARVLPDSTLVHWWQALAYEQVNRLAEARQELEQVAAGAIFGESQLYTAIGRFAVRAADAPGAIDAFARAIRADPNDPATHKLLASALMQQDRADEAMAEFVAAVLIDPEDAAAHAGIGQIHLHAGRDAEAVDALRRATDLAPANGETRYALASALQRLGRTEEAAAHFTRVEQAQRQMLTDQRRELSAAALKQEAAVRAAEGRFDAAIALYEKALLAVEADPVVYGRLADLYAKVGRAADAARARAMSEKSLQPLPAGRSPAR